ncbi:MAG: glycosyltransferase family 2 protein [Bacteroidales bacterium]|nr:glycosyltransferase family 2 protein [Bacteroidales bacterium]
MNSVRIFLEILLWIFYAYVAITSLYIFIFAFAGLFRYRKKSPKDNIQRKFAILIPGYKEDEIIVEVCRDALEQDYPKDKYDVVAIADSYQPETLAALRELPIKVIEVSFEKSTKSKALNKAMEVLGDAYDIALILDADNLIADDFLMKMNEAFQAGYIAVQGHRVAKNADTGFAVLDAISEEINNHIFRKGARIMGVSSAIIGSGMAFEYSFFKTMMKDVHAIGGFDKEIDLKMCRDGITIEYIHDAYCYDEKVQKAEVFQHQRRRWLSAQWVYFKRFFLASFIALISKGNIDYFNKAFHTFLPPRILLLGFMSIIFFISLFFLPGVMAFAWIGLFALVVLTFFLSVPAKFYSMQTLKAIWLLPKGFFLMFLSLLKLKGANKQFLHTKHSSSGTSSKEIKNKMR